MLKKLEHGGAFQDLLLLYTQALMSQMMQTAACNRHHSVEQQLCRWRLISLDRLPDTRVMMSQRLIHCDRDKITVLDRPKLETLCCVCYAVVKQETDHLIRDRVPVRTERLARI